MTAITLLNYTAAELTAMPLAELKDICTEHQIECVGHKGKKQTFIDAILNYQPKTENSGQFLLFDTEQFTVKPKAHRNHYDLEDGDGFDGFDFTEPASFVPSPVYPAPPSDEPDDERDEDETVFPIEESHESVESLPAEESPFDATEETRLHQWAEEISANYNRLQGLLTVELPERKSSIEPTAENRESEPPVKASDDFFKVPANCIGDDYEGETPHAVHKNCPIFLSAPNGGIVGVDFCLNGEWWSAFTEDSFDYFDSEGILNHAKKAIDELVGTIPKLRLGTATATATKERSPPD